MKMTRAPAISSSTAGQAVAAPVVASAPVARFCVAGIGASAGGLEAICEFFAAMPADSGIAFVVIQHLYPTQKSLAAEIIGKHSAISAKPAEEGMRVAPTTSTPFQPTLILRSGAVEFSLKSHRTRPGLACRSTTFLLRWAAISVNVRSASFCPEAAQTGRWD